MDDMLMVNADPSNWEEFAREKEREIARKEYCAGNRKYFENLGTLTSWDFHKRLAALAFVWGAF